MLNYIKRATFLEELAKSYRSIATAEVSIERFSEALALVEKEHAKFKEAYGVKS